MSFESALIFATVEGSILALLALGFSLVFGVGGVLNLGHILLLLNLYRNLK